MPPQCASLSLDLALEALTGHPLPPGVDAVRLRRLYQTIIAGLYSLPVNLPGTPLHRALRARRELEVLLGPVVESEIRPVEDKVGKGGAGGLTAVDLRLILCKRGANCMARVEACFNVRSCCLQSGHMQ